jgi:hypothetical protein
MVGLHLWQRGPHPAVGHLLPFCFAEQEKGMEFGAFARAAQRERSRMGEGGQRLDEGSFFSPV